MCACELITSVVGKGAREIEVNLSDSFGNRFVVYLFQQLSSSPTFAETAVNTRLAHSSWRLLNGRPARRNSNGPSRPSVTVDPEQGPPGPSD